MGEKDLTQKQLLEWEDTFADIVNTLLLDGRELVKPDDLKPTKRDSLYKDKELKNRLQERDIAKLWERGGIRLAFFGLEDQTTVHQAMPLRVIGYDGAVYRDELNIISTENTAAKPPLQFYPVITMVLHFDYEHRWTGPRRLKECFSHIPAELDPYINDYNIHVFEIAWLPDETIAKFKSDFRFVADYYSQMRKTGKWKPMSGKVRHVKELFDLFGTLTDDTRFVEMYHQRKGAQNNMSSLALDYLAAEYLARGEAIGLERGEAIGLERGEAIGLERGEAIGLERGEAIGLERGKAIGLERGMERGAERVNKLIQCLIRDGRTEQIATMTTDGKLQADLMKQYNID